MLGLEVFVVFVVFVGVVFVGNEVEHGNFDCFNLFDFVDLFNF